MLIYNICFTLSDLFHLVWQSLGPSMSLWITQLRSFLWLIFHFVHAPNLLYQITNENLLYNAANSTQCSVWPKWERSPKREAVCIHGLLWWLSSKESACQCRRHRFDPWVRRIPGEGNGNPLLCSCLGNPMDRGVWQSTVDGVTKSQAWLSD